MGCSRRHKNDVNQDNHKYFTYEIYKKLQKIKRKVAHLILNSGNIYLSETDQFFLNKLDENEHSCMNCFIA